ncbi:MAG: hypothetical protein A2289_23080 [Deltaproteobacteria bacterium RIFOXYA12_FULL_58_15]|nr:MAG: hypothetical protein A2289_23080 [Deltaproteobacteria bacterium RIFOXYA12_FULL_58_15]
MGASLPMCNIRLAISGIALSVVVTTGCQRRDVVVPPNCFALLTTTDVHGAIFPHEYGAGDRTVRKGGLIGLSGYLRILRQRYGDKILLLDAGDMFQGTLISTLSQGRAITEAYNLLGYDAAAVGNHEFDLGRLSTDHPDPTGVLSTRMAESRFPFLTLNIFERETGERVRWPNSKPSILLDVGKVRVGVLGVSTTETPLVTRSDLVAHLEFRDPAPLIVSEARRLRDRGADIVVLLGHLGGQCDQPNDGTTCELDSELFNLLRQLPQRTIDVAIGGHRHESVANWFDDIATIEATAAAKQLGWVDVCVSPTGGIDRARSTIHPLVDLCLEQWPDGTCSDTVLAGPIRRATFMKAPVEPDPALELAMQPFRSEARAQYERPINATLPNRLPRDGALSVGPHVCRAMAEAAHTAIALQNRGGVRADLPSGPLRFGQVFEVLPFSNQVTILDLSGDELQRIIAYMSQRRGLPPHTYGLDVRVDADTVSTALADGSAIDPQKRYQLATNDFLATGGEGLDRIIGNMDDSRRHFLGMTILDAMLAYLERTYPITSSTETEH